MQEYYTRSRYPFILNEDVVSPSEYVNAEKSSNAIEMAGKVVEAVLTYLRRNGIDV
ncbi:MAG: hypothetical protein NXY59_00270 [Aigarchaeota archaeon]|nr:hypothetical protein [Candidatus Pelearchaeum maunauluense]